MQKLIPVLAMAVFLSGSSWITWRLHWQAYDDLPTFYWATHLAFEDKVSAYQPVYFHHIGETLGRKIYPFLYPPPSVMLFSPFLLGNYEQAKTVFTLFNLLLWWLLLWIVSHFYRFNMGHAHPEQHHMVVAAILLPLWIVTFVPVIDTLRTGQVNLLVFACLSPLFFQTRSRVVQYASGVLLALAVILKVYLLLLLPILLLMREKRLLVSAACALAVLCLASTRLLPENMWRDWLVFGLHGSSYGKPLTDMMTIPWNQSINGFFIRQYLDTKMAGDMATRKWWSYLVCGALLFCLFAIVVWKRKQPGFSTCHAVALALLTMTLVAPLTWQHHFVFALPAALICIAWSMARWNRPGQGWLVAGVWFCVSFISYPWLASALFPGNELNAKGISLATNLVLSAQSLAALGLWILFCFLALRPNAKVTC